MPKSSRLTPAKISWRDQRTPVADHFDDVYFSKVDGLRESEYVFLAANQVCERWQQHQHPAFVIGETGFGTGLNFLATLRAFKRFRAQNPGSSLRLFFLSTEKFPLSQADLTLALNAWPELADEAQALLAQYPPLIAGCHRLEFVDGAVVLDLWFGDIAELLPSWYRPVGGLVDAWYLDGFAPSKNPQMWQPALYQQMARLSRNHASFATFTAAGMVRRGLAEVGFAVRKIKGFGSKREMAVGEFTQPELPLSYPDKVTLVGGGLASAALSLAYAKNHVDVTLICADSELAQQASGNHQGALYPQLHLQWTPMSQFYSAAFCYSSRLLRLAKPAANYQACGVLQLGYDDASDERLRKLIDSQLYPEALVRYVEPDEASKLAGVTLQQGGLLFAAGGWVQPASWIDSMLAQAATHVKLSIQLNCTITAVHKDAQQWRLKSDQGEHLTEHLLLATGAAALLVEAPQLQLGRIRGQVSHLRATAQSSALKTVLCARGYTTPALQGIHCSGATFIRNDQSTELRASEHAHNVRQLSNDIKQPWAASLGEQLTGGRAGIRCSSRNYLPVCGALDHQPSPVRVLLGLGSRGLCSAPLAAECVVAEHLGLPMPVSQTLWMQLCASAK